MPCIFCSNPALCNPVCRAFEFAPDAVKAQMREACAASGQMTAAEVSAHVEAGEMPAKEEDARDLWFAEWQLVLPKDAREAWPGWQSADGVREPVEAQQCDASAQRVWWCHEGSLGRPRCEWQCPVCEGDDNDEAAPAGVGPVDGGQR